MLKANKETLKQDFSEFFESEIKDQKIQNFQVDNNPESTVFSTENFSEFQKIKKLTKFEKKLFKVFFITKENRK